MGSSFFLSTGAVLMRAMAVAVAMIFTGGAAIAAMPVGPAKSSEAADGPAGRYTWEAKCTDVPSASLVLCRIVPEVRQGIVSRTNVAPIMLLLDNHEGRSIVINGDLCLDSRTRLIFGDSAVFYRGYNEGFNGPTFDQIITEFRKAGSGSVKYAPLPDCKTITATVGFGNLDEALDRAEAALDIAD